MSGGYDKYANILYIVLDSQGRQTWKCKICDNNNTMHSGKGLHLRQSRGPEGGSHVPEGSTCQPRAAFLGCQARVTPLRYMRHASGTRGMPHVPEAVHPKWMICLEGLRHSLAHEACLLPMRLSLGGFARGTPRGQETASGTRGCLLHLRLSTRNE